MSCKCITDADKKLASKNAKLTVTFNLMGQVFPQIMVEKADTKKRGPLPILVPTFCPFCGKKYVFRSKTKG